MLFQHRDVTNKSQWRPIIHLIPPQDDQCPKPEDDFWILSARVLSLALIISKVISDYLFCHSMPHLENGKNLRIKSKYGGGKFII